MEVEHLTFKEAGTADRRTRILEYVMENQRADVAELAAMMAASPATTRRDLESLERGGLLRREHGFPVAACEDSGFTARNLLRAEAVRAMARQAESLVVVTESIKFPKQGAVRLADAAGVRAVYTDDRLPPFIQPQLTAAGVTVVKVAAGSPQAIA